MTFSKKVIVTGFAWIALSKYTNRPLGFITTLILTQLSGFDLEIEGVENNLLENQWVVCG